MRTLAITLLVAMLCLVPVSQAGADICNDIDDLSNAWNDIANALEVDNDEDIGDLDIKRLARDVNALLPDTENLGDFLVDEGNADENRIGNDLLDVVDDLYDVTEDDLAAYLVDRIDDLVDCLDFTVDYCDAVNDY